MVELFLIVRDILLLKRGPQDLPYAPTLTALAVAAMVLFEVALALVLGRAADKSLLHALVAVGISAGLLYLILNARQMLSRYVQTLLASVLCGFVFTLASIPVAILIGEQLPQSPEAMTPQHTLAGLIGLVVIVWSLIVDAHILRHALNVPFFAGLVVAISMMFAKLVLVAALLGKTAGA